MKTFLFVLIAMEIVFLRPMFGTGITLVNRGTSHYVIYLPEHATIVEKFAAHELQKYLDRISGAKLAIRINNKNERVHGIFIGEKLARRFGVNINAKYPGLDGFLIKTFKGNIILAGGEGRGTLYAVYELLKEIGCRWYAPNFTFYGSAGGEYVPKIRTIILPNLDKVESPSFKYRKKYVEEGWTHTVANMKKLIDWMAKVKMNVFSYPLDYQHLGRVKWDNVREELVPELQKRGIMIEVGGHGYPNFLPPGRYFKKHPEWFAEINGKRTADPHAVFNTSNTEALNMLVNNVIEYISRHPEIDILDLWPPDNAQWSEDTRSLAQGSPSRRQAIILNTVAKAVKKKFPHVRIEFIAYQSYLFPPKNIKIDSSVIMDLCPIRRTSAYPIWDYRAGQNVPYHNALLQWFKRDVFKGNIGIYSYYRRYIWRSLPVVIPNIIAEDMRWYHSLGVIGLSSYSEPGDWFTFELTHYTIAKLSWNVNISVPNLVKDYCLHRFGPAAQEMKKYFKIIEQTLPMQNRVAFNNTPTLRESRNYMHNLGILKLLLQQAKQKAQLSKNRNVLFLLDKLSLSLEYTRLDLEIGELSMRMAGAYIKNGVKQLEQLQVKMVKLFNANLNKGIFISRGGRYYPDK